MKQTSPLACQPASATSNEHVADPFKKKPCGPSIPTDQQALPPVPPSLPVHTRPLLHPTLSVVSSVRCTSLHAAPHLSLLCPHPRRAAPLRCADRWAAAPRTKAVACPLMKQA
ncbi:hypothetical protein SETIT_2G129600v2 [Setaria italica]|uniref:Uncharacterized protein n=1 Tax=Setaria italica TaxID=4555 RepID=A0A368PY28_SETIT|nr:hypothetical protein SETIT_2G129600v2 [Setaria italica]